MNGQDVKPLFEDPSASAELRNFVALARSDGPSDADLQRLAARLGPAVGLSAGILLTGVAASGGALGTAPAELVSLLQPGVAKLGLFGKLLASGSSKLLAVGLSAGIGVGLWASMESSQHPPKDKIARSPAAQLPTPEPAPPVAAAGGGRAAGRPGGAPSEEPRSEVAPTEGQASRVAALPEPAVVSSPAKPGGSGRTRSRRAAAARVPASVTKEGASDSPVTPTAAPERPSELSLIQQAEAARGQGAEALALLASHERFYPHGALAQEREVLAIELLVKTGKVEQARARAERFASSHPSSAHLPRVRALIARTANE